MLERDPLQQEQLLAQRCGGDVFLRSDFHRGRFERAGLHKATWRSATALERLGPMRLDDVATPATLLLARSAHNRPEANDQAPPRRVKQGKTQRVKDLAERGRYWPVRWTEAEDLPLAYSAQDAELLAGLGRRLFEQAGLTNADRALAVLEDCSARDRWQIEAGAGKLGLSLQVQRSGYSPQRLARLDPTVIIGSWEELQRIAEEADESGLFRRVHTLVLVGETSAEAIAILQSWLWTGVEIVRFWAPAGVLSLWGQCRGGQDFHTWPAYEVVELVDPFTHLRKPTPEPANEQSSARPSLPGLILWTGLGWYATALIRLDTDVAAALTLGRCPTCGRTSLRLSPAEAEFSFADVLDAIAPIQTWAATLTATQGPDQLDLYVALDDGATSLTVLEAIDIGIGRAEVHIVSQDEVASRWHDANGEQYVDRRADADF